MHEILIVDDHRMFSLGLSELLSRHFPNTVINVLHNVKDAISYLKDHSVNVLICDLNLNKEDGFSILRACRVQLSSTQVIVLSAYFEQNLIVEAQKLKVNAYLPKETVFSELLKTITSPESHAFHPQNLALPNDKKLNLEDEFSNAMLLSNREKDIIRYLSEGLMSKEIADKLGLTKLTIDTHRKNIRKKLGLKTLGEIIRFAHANNLIN